MLVLWVWVWVGHWGGFVWPILTPPCFQSQRPKETKQPVLAGYCHLQCSVHKQRNFSKSCLWWNHIWNRLSTYISSKQRILTHRNSHVLTSTQWQHCFVFYNLECVARDTLCNSDLSQWKAQQILKCVLQMQIVFVLQIQIRSLSSAIHICPAEIPEACATIRKSDNIPATLICNIQSLQI